MTGVDLGRILADTRRSHKPLVFETGPGEVPLVFCNLCGAFSQTCLRQLQLPCFGLSPTSRAAGQRLRRLRSAAVDEARPAGDVVLPSLQEEAVLFALQPAGRRPDRRLPALRPRRSLRAHEAVVRCTLGVSHRMWVSLPCVGLKTSRLVLLKKTILSV